MKMKNLELQAIIAGQQDAATGAFGSSLSQNRASLMAGYNADPYGDEVEDRSSIVMTDIRDTIESIKPELMDIFYGGDKVVEFSPRGDEDVEAAAQETEVLNYVFNQQNGGFMVLYSLFTDALTVKNGYVKRYWDERNVVEIEEYDELDPEEAYSILAELDAGDDEVEILEQWGGQNELGEIEPVGFKVRVTKELKSYKVVPVPPEEILVSAQWNKLDFVGCPYVAHRSSVTVSDLIEMGFDRKQVESLPESNGLLDSEEAVERFEGGDSFESGLTSNPDISMRKVIIYENYIRADRDGDGVAELLQVFTGSEHGEILKRNGKDAIEEVRSTPFNSACPVPIPHKHHGMSMAEMVSDLQRLRTVLTRQLVDNVVISNNPDIVVDSDSITDETVEDLAITQPGRVVRIPGGARSVTYATPPQSVGQSLAAIEYVDGVRESRTGVTKYNQGLDANSLNKTATGISKIMSASQKKILLIARVFAETAVSQIFLDMHADLRSGPMRSITAKLNNEWVDVDPRTWKHRADMTVNVGLGSGDRDAQFTKLSYILSQQKEAAAAGMLEPKYIYNTLKKMIELSGYKDVSAFFPDPSQAPPQPQEPERPDPTMLLLELETKKADIQLQTKMAELEIKRMDAETKRMQSDNTRLNNLMVDDRERDLKAADIEADEAARIGSAVSGQELVQNGG